MADISEIILPNNSNYSIKDSYARSQLSDIADSIPPEMTILSYGYSTWDDFISAYNSHSVVYCRASSNSNPASGSQTRMAFMAYVNNGDSPTNVEFQYYRSVSTHSASQQGDQVYIYKLDKTAGWSVTVREAKIKIAAGIGLTESFASNTLTLSRVDELPTVTTSDNGKVLTVSSGEWAAVTPGASVSGVKGDAESTYRTGNVNLTPADLGIINFTGATSEDDGASGLVPTPTATNSKQILLSNGNWTPLGTGVSADSNNDTLTVGITGDNSYLTYFTLWPATESQPGLMSTENVVALNGKVNKTGDTLTGKLISKENNLDITNTPASNVYNGAIDFVDTNEKQFGNITRVFQSDGYYGISIGVYDSDSNISNSLSLLLNDEGTKKISVEPAIWRSALGIGTIGTKNTLTESDIPNIAASKINSGALAVTYGGTGKTTATEAWTALGGGAIGKKATLSSADIPDNAADTSGNAGTATKLKTARSLYVALGTVYNSSSPVTFDGSAAKALPVNGTLAIAHGGTGKTTATEAWTALGGGAIGKKASLTAADIPNHSTSKLTSGTLGIARGGTGSSAVTTVLSNSTWTILAWGPLVMVQCHGAQAAANNTTMLNGTLASYKPAYNVSTIVADTSASNHVARMYVEASSGSVKLASVGYTTSTAWYGTLVYMLA